MREGESWRGEDEEEEEEEGGGGRKGGRMGKGEEKELYQKLLTTVTIKWKVTENNRNDYENVNIDYKISVSKKK